MALDQEYQHKTDFMSSVKNQNNIVQKLMQNLAEIQCFYAIIAIKHIISMH